MIEELKDGSAVSKTGGRFKLAALVQKRVAELMEGGRPLIEDIDGLSMIEIAIKEVMQDKIAIEWDTEAEARNAARALSKF